MNQLQERMPACALSQTKEMDTFAKRRAKAIKSCFATDKGLVGL
jgi:hypothetical protein